MKIIGEADNGLIAIISSAECKKLADIYTNLNSRVKIGTEIDIHAMYDQAKFINEHPDEIKTVQKSLKRIIDNLELLSPFTVPAEKEETGEDE